MIVVGIPTCVQAMSFLLNYKFCRTYDEEKDCYLGGMTVCEFLTFVLTCGKAMQRKEVIKDNYVYQDVHENVIEEESNVEEAPKPKIA